MAAEDLAHAVRVLLDTLHAAVRGTVGAAGAAETAAARGRCRARLLAALDDPFGPVDEAARARRGEPSLAGIARAIGEFQQLPVLEPTCRPPAIAVVGAPTTHQLTSLEALLETL